MIDVCCKKCRGRLVTLETYCTDPYQTSTKMPFVGFEHNEIQNLQSIIENSPSVVYSKNGHTDEWYRDIKKRCVCSACGLEQDITIDRVKQPEMSK